MNFKFHLFKEEDRVQLLLSGLKDPDNFVTLYCRQYLVQQICAKEGQEPKITTCTNAEKISQEEEEEGVQPEYQQERKYEVH